VPDEELVDHYRMADIFVMPSTGEGFGIVFLEAMACGIPAIGGNADGSTDPLSGASAGQAMPLEQIADCIAEILENPSQEGDSRTLAARFGLEPFAAQVADMATLLMSTGR
jgi:glycosyltransferase involved in cell wall biosynthesis